MTSVFVSFIVIIIIRFVLVFSFKYSALPDRGTPERTSVRSFSQNVSHVIIIIFFGCVRDVCART